MTIGYDMAGAGAKRVIVLHDWMSDASEWGDVRPYLDPDAFAWVFADLRGYGRSRGIAGKHSIVEAAGDVTELADSLRWPQFAIVGHSMSTLVALHLAQQVPSRVRCAVVVTPPPPRGFGADAAAIASMQQMARAGNAERHAWLKARLGDRLSPRWAVFKAERWCTAADPNAVAEYYPMFARDGLPNPSARISVPVLAITGEQDAEPMRRTAVTQVLEPLCEQLTVTPMLESGHYPMQEAPPALAAVMERFLAVTA